jgi:GTP 3',8-cyclase
MKNTLTNIIHRWGDIYMLQQGYMVLPHFVDLHTSNRCNHRCRGCAYDGMLDHDIMPEDKHYKAIDTFLNIGVMAFDFAGGGEPTLLPYLPDLLRYIKSKGAYYGLITNGSNISDELMDVLVDTASYVRFSIEASNREMFRAYKGVDHFDKVMRNMQEMVEEKYTRNSEIEISAKYSVGKSLKGVDHYTNAIKYCESIGVDWITFKALRHEPEELSSSQLVVEEYTLCEELGTDAERRAKVRYWIRPYEDIPQCWLNPFHTVMDHLGNLYICCYYYHRDMEKHRLGNIFEQSFSEIWFSDKHKEKIKAIQKHECALVDCKFFHHHTAVEKSMERGKVFFL